MPSQTRRRFLKRSGLGAAGAVLSVRAGRSAGADDRVAIGVLGCSRGRYLAGEFTKHNVRIAYICDPDENRMQQAKRDTGADHGVTDLRRILDDKGVDAVVVATPDHWHTPASLLALEAGKHVYVEKPCSHNIREGRLLVEAARRTKLVVAHGTQSRSTTVLKNGIDLLRRGAIGTVLVAKAWNSQKRKNIGHEKEAKPPAGFDYDLWIGPAPLRPFRPNCHHYTWHWWFDFGTGDAGNDGVHELDIAVWGLGAETHPSRVSGYASKMYFDDDQEFPDTQYVTFEYPGEGTPGTKRLLHYEHRIWSPYELEGFDNGNAFYGTDGYMIMSKRGGWRQYAPGGKLVKEEKGPCSIPEHLSNFLAAIQSGRRPSADAEIAHRSATLAHLANLLAKAGCGSIRFDPAAERVLDDPRADAMAGRTYRDGHWAVPKGV